MNALKSDLKLENENCKLYFKACSNKDFGATYFSTIDSLNMSSSFWSEHCHVKYECTRASLCL